MCIRDRDDLDDAPTITVKLNGAIVGSGFSVLDIDLSLRTGRNMVEILAIDHAGNEALKTSDVTVDITPPSIDLDGIPSGPVRGGDETNITWSLSDSGSGLDRAFMTIDGSNRQSIGPLGSMALDRVGEGTHTLTLTAQDLAGNVATEIVEFTIDMTDPELLDTGPKERISDRWQELSFIFSESMDPLTTTIDTDDLLGRVEWTGPRAVFIPASPIPIGDPVNFLVRGRDLAGNQMIPRTVTFWTVNEGYLTGRVLTPGGEPVSGIRVILDNGRFVETDREGRFNITSPLGDRKITFKGEGKDQRVRSAWVDPGTTTDMGVVQMDKAGSDPIISSSTMVTILSVSIVTLSLIGAIAYLVVTLRKERYED
jgi:hypothetical protein